MSNLYIVATPIGNLKDITLRALDILKQADIILCEDTRTTKKLLSAHEISTRCMAFHKFSTEKEIEHILNLFDEHEHIALVSDAGTPAISDPGSLLVKLVQEQKPEVIIAAIPGASALTAALSISGLPLSQFTFVGFLPHKKGRQKKLDEALANSYAVVLYESTHRILKLLEEINSRQPERKIIICKELTKIHERVLKGTASELLNEFDQNPSLQKGEFVVICE
ncbi:MAG: uroporphyrin-III C/tetrapyrrole (Corrin/Porphyrin) methyltransferase, rRNA [Candidatus Parcubacteria bacterium]|jgi:16S rRNA (cytidine1402-2'-O)-methyltransferase